MLLVQPAHQADPAGPTTFEFLVEQAPVTTEAPAAPQSEPPPSPMDPTLNKPLPADPEPQLAPPAPDLLPVPPPEQPVALPEAVPPPPERPPPARPQPAAAPRPAPPRPASAPPRPAREAAASSAPALPAAPSAPVAPPASEISPGWRAALYSWLQSHKTYPDLARRQGAEGRAVFRITVSRTGQVLEFALVSGTGSPVLDDAVRSLMQGAQLPPFPPGMSGAKETVTAAIHYRLER